MTECEAQISLNRSAGAHVNLLQRNHQQVQLKLRPTGTSRTPKQTAGRSPDQQAAGNVCDLSLTPHTHDSSAEESSQARIGRAGGRTLMSSIVQVVVGITCVCAWVCECV